MPDARNLGDGLFPAPAGPPSAPAPDRGPVPLSARVPADLRLRVLAARRVGETASDVVRRLLELGLDAEAAAARALDDRPGAHRRRAGSTERAAALAKPGRRGTQRRRALDELVQAGPRGLTADELVVLMHPAPHNGTARRLTDLVQGGLATPARVVVDADYTAGFVVGTAAFGVRAFAPRERAEPDGTVSRPTRAGSRGTVYVATSAGVSALVDTLRQEREENP